MLGNDLLRGEWVYLDAVTRDDIPLFGKWFSDLELLSYLGMQAVFPQTEEDEKEWFEQMRTREGYTFAVRTIEGHNMIGTVSLMNIHWRNRHAEFGISIGDKRYWGKGYGTDATRVILRYAFYELNLHRVELKVYSFNGRAIKSYEKVGFVHEGTRRQCIFRDGQYHDIHMMGILRDEWLKTLSSDDEEA